VVDPGGAVGAGGRVLRQGLGAGDAVGGDVVLEEAVEERHLEVQRGLVGGEDGRADGVGVLLEPGGVEPVPHVDDPHLLEGGGVGDGDPPVALRPVQPGGVERGVAVAYGHVADVPAVGAEAGLVRLVAGPEGTDLRAGCDVQHVHRFGRGGGDRDPGAVGGDGHVVGAVTRHRGAPADPAGGEDQGADGGEAGPGGNHRGAVRGGVRAVDQLAATHAVAVAAGREGDP